MLERKKLKTRNHGVPELRSFLVRDIEELTFLIIDKIGALAIFIFPMASDL